MAKKKDIKVIVSFDNKKYSPEEAMFDKIELLFLLRKMQIEQDYKNKKISEEEFKFLNYQLEIIKNKLEKNKNI
ncbi:hypothetical protein IKU74_04345 [bacterium]|nr:hypothetical protein [bacterium]